MDVMYQGSRIRRSTGTVDKRLAEAILGKVKSQIIEGVFFDRSPEQERTFDDMMKRYLVERSPLKAPKSGIRDQSALKHLLPMFGQRVLGHMTPKMFAEYKVQRRLEGAAPATVNKELQLVRHAFNLAMREWEWCRTNPMHRVALEQVRNEVDRWLTVEEETRLIAVSSPWLQGIILFALNTGMRQGEILNLHWEHIDFERGVLIVMKSKNGTRRTIPLITPVFKLLSEMQARTGQTKGPVFLSPRGRALKVRYLVREFCSARDQAGIPDFRFHDMRHTLATRLVQQGVDLYTVQRILGHKTGIMTQRYAHHSPESLRAGLSVLEKPFRIGTNLTQETRMREATRD
jgi:integrase